eukprot:855415-Rhodomonas_salina.2
MPGTDATQSAIGLRACYALHSTGAARAATLVLRAARYWRGCYGPRRVLRAARSTPLPATLQLRYELRANSTVCYAGATPSPVLSARVWGYQGRYSSPAIVLCACYALPGTT